MQAHWSRLGAALLGLAVGAAFLALAFRGTPAGAVWALLAAGHWGAPAAAVLVGTVLFVLAKTARWRLLLGSPHDLPLARLAPAVLAGLAVNALLPHAGEFVRAAALQRQAGRAASAVLSSIVAERVFDLFGVLLLGALALTQLPVSADVAAAVRLLGLVAATLAAAVVVALALPARIEALAAWVARPLPVAARHWLLGEVRAALGGLAPVRTPVVSLRVLAWSVLQWLAIALCVAGCAGVVGFAAGPAASCLVVVGIVVTFLLPNAPGYAGSVQLAFVATLKPLGVPEPAALAASFVYQLLMVLPLIVAGLACLRASLARGAVSGP